MKNAIIAIMLVFGFVGSSYAGDCAGGVCRAPLLQPVRKVVTISKNIVLAPVRALAVVTAPKSCCETVSSDSCDCGCSVSTATSTKEVVKYQPLRRRLVNRSTTVTRCQ
jgi:hypothetical protein